MEFMDDKWVVVEGPTNMWIKCILNCLNYDLSSTSQTCNRSPRKKGKGTDKYLFFTYQYLISNI